MNRDIKRGSKCPGAKRIRADFYLPKSRAQLFIFFIRQISITDTQNSLFFKLSAFCQVTAQFVVEFFKFF